MISDNFLIPARKATAITLRAVAQHNSRLATELQRQLDDVASKNEALYNRERAISSIPHATDIVKQSEAYAEIARETALDIADDIKATATKFASATVTDANNTATEIHQKAEKLADEITEEATRVLEEATKTNKQAQKEREAFTQAIKSADTILIEYRQRILALRGTVKQLREAVSTALAKQTALTNKLSSVSDYASL